MWPDRHWQSLVHDICLLMACTDVLDEDILHRKGFTSACDIDAMEFGQMLEFRAEALGNYCQHCLVILIDLKHKSGRNQFLANSQKRNSIPKQRSAQSDKFSLRCRS